MQVKSFHILYRYSKEANVQRYAGPQTILAVACTSTDSSRAVMHQCHAALIQAARFWCWAIASIRTAIQ